MTTKEKILAVVNKLDDDTTIAQTIHRLVLLEMVERALRNRGKWIEHDELFDRLEKEDEKSHALLVARRPNRSAATKKANQSRRSAKSNRVHRKAEAVSK